VSGVEIRCNIWGTFFFSKSGRKQTWRDALNEP